MRILVFADSRGQHKKGNHPLYTDMLKKAGYHVDSYLCPYKWTTTLDFLELNALGVIDCSIYDWVILHTGIVEHSPRCLNNAKNDLYNPEKTENLENIRLDTRDYSQKVINNKKRTFDAVFGESSMEEHFSKPFDVMYEEDKTINMYSIPMLKDKLLPILKKIPNLIWISGNKIVEGWRGNYFRERPANIGMVLEYSKIMAKELNHVVDLTVWDDTEVKKYTLDNMHLSEAGNKYIFEKLSALLNKS